MRAQIFIFAVVLSSACAPVKLGSKEKASQKSDDGAQSSTPAQDAVGKAAPEGSNAGVSATNLSGRQVDLYSIRAGNAQVFLPPEFDKLPCAYFRQGPQFEIPPIPGGPPLPMRGPVQNFYAGQWTKETEYSFKLSVYKRIYRDPGIPDWLSTAPTSRVSEYVLRLFDVVISSPTTTNCSISARALN